jgi:cytochrome c-type biogenesis protein CcmH/NrfG
VVLDDAERVLREYLRVKPHATEIPADWAWWRLGQVLEKQQRIADAKAAYQKALGISPRDRDYRASMESLERSTARE